MGVNSKGLYIQQDHSSSFPTRAYALPSNRFSSQHMVPNMDSLLFKTPMVYCFHPYQLYHCLLVGTSFWQERVHC